ncbi:MULTISPECIES: winged helix-turn-helix domain-containing protein [Actinoplanes]|uniref:ArsR/SmtB family transcription factor n=1 Tax=Actinoplanes TaxID=1865 RepID=UPI0005F2C6D8|nr:MULTISPECIES: winged helix-turn-helix domain-containing protein [Actinoplanes]GLY05817.1 transcriptional regulator [Actinoplanes sp. NBRC 101535]
MAEQGSGRSNVWVTDARTMRALAHPVRVEIVDHLIASGATMSATECAELVGLSPSAASYHLRELAKYGLVEHAPGRGDGRERLWRGVGNSLYIAGDTDQPESVAAERALIDLNLSRNNARITAYVEQQSEEPKEWRDAAGIQAHQLLLTAEELQEITEQVRAVLEPYRVRERQAEAPEGARAVFAYFAAVPKV